MSIPVVKVPTFTMTLPLTGEVVSYRPFLVKEEKLLIMANEDGNIKEITNAVTQLVKDCTSDVMKPDTHSMFDIQYAFLQIRGKSISEEIPFYLICENEGCGYKTETSVRIDQFQFRENPEHTNTIDLGVGIKVIMRYPSFEKYGLLYDRVEDDAVFDVVASCIEKIVTEDEVYVNENKDTLAEVRGFLDSITPEQFSKLEVFFTTMPILEYVHPYTCKGCGIKNSVTIDGVRNFFE